MTPALSPASSPVFQKCKRVHRSLEDQNAGIYAGLMRICFVVLTTSSLLPGFLASFFLLSLTTCNSASVFPFLFLSFISVVHINLCLDSFALPMLSEQFRDTRLISLHFFTLHFVGIVVFCTCSAACIPSRRSFPPSSAASVSIHQKKMLPLTFRHCHLLCTCPASQVPHAINRTGSNAAETDALRELFRTSSSIRGYRTASLPSGSNIPREPSFDAGFKFGQEIQTYKTAQQIGAVGQSHQAETFRVRIEQARIEVPHSV